MRADETPISDSPTSRKRQRSQNIGHNMPVGQKLILHTNYLCQPHINDPVTVAFQTKVGIIARRDIRICYMDWRRDVPPTDIEDAIKCLGEHFEYDYQESLDTPYTRKKLNGAWRTFKSQLYQEYVEDENPSLVKEAVPDDLAIPLEDWRQFVDNCNTDQYKVCLFLLLICYVLCVFYFRVASWWSVEKGFITMEWSSACDFVEPVE